MGLILLVVILLFFFGGLPQWGYHSYGYGPSGLLFVVLIILIVWMFMGRRL